ncbi:MAG: alanine racemase, partial [Wenzhouxiangellaceae bacterium]
MHAPDTPCLLLDEARMERNLTRLRRALDHHGVAFRPHVKTCKNPEIATRMRAGIESPGITVSTLAEAEAFFQRGFDDQIYAVGIGPGKLARVTSLVDQGLALKLILDHTETAHALAETPHQPAGGFDLLIEIDADGQRAGL